MPAPLFFKYIKSYDIKNKQNLILRQKTKENVQLAQEQVILEPEPNFWQGLQPKLTDNQKNQIKEFYKNSNYEENQNRFGGVSNYQHNQMDRLNNIKSDLFHTYLNDQFLNGWLVPTLKKANPSIDNIERGVKKLGDIGAESKSGPNKKNETVTQSSNKSQPQIETPKEEEWKLEVGTRFDLIRQKGRGWFNCDFFNSEAQIDAGGFRTVNYQVNINKEIFFTKDTSVPFYVVRAVLSTNSTGHQVGEVNTKLSTNINLKYANEFKSHNDTVMFNYSINF